MHPAQYLRRQQAAEYLKSKYGHGSIRTLAKLATLGGGPVFRKVGKLVVYTTDDLDAWALSKISAPCRSTSEHERWAGEVRPLRQGTQRKTCSGRGREFESARHGIGREYAVTATPALPMLAAGRKPRPRRAPRDRPKEFELRVAVAQHLRKHAGDDWRWTHIPNGELRDKRTAAKFKAMGERHGWPDIILVSPHNSIRCLELERQGESLSDEQEEFRIWCICKGIPYAFAHAIEEVMAALDHWGCLRLQIAEGQP